MNCFQCGAGDQKNEAYCKRCGKWIGSNPPDKRLGVMLIFSLLSAIFSAFSAIALYATYLGSESAKWSVYMAAAFCIIISVHQTINFFFTLSLLRRIKESGAGSATAPEIPASRDTRSLEDGSKTQFVGVPSVTENTTELLRTAARNESSQ